jgi:hypothetical protein
MNLDKISDEQLAQFIDGNSSPKEIDAILDAVSSEEDLETLVLAYSAKTKIEEDSEEEDMPDIKDLGKTIKMQQLERLPMAGFLGDTSIDDPSDKDDETKQ